MNKNEWIKLVLERDNSICCRCNKTTSNVIVISSNEKTIYEVRNGITIYTECVEEYKTKNGEESDWHSWEKFVNEKGRTLRKPVITKK